MTVAHPSEETAIEIDGLRKSYGGFEAVRGLSLRVRRGEIFAHDGHRISGGDLAVLAAWGLAGLLLAVRFFAWTPRRQAG